MLSGMLTATAIIATILKIGKEKGIKFILFLIYLLALNPAILMWGTSLRWYSYILPVLIWLMAIPKNNKWHWPKFLSIVVMGLLGHIIYFILLSVFLYYWLKDERKSNKKQKPFLLRQSLLLLLISPNSLTFSNTIFQEEADKRFHFHPVFWESCQAVLATKVYFLSLPAA